MITIIDLKLDIPWYISTHDRYSKRCKYRWQLNEINSAASSFQSLKPKIFIFLNIYEQYSQDLNENEYIFKRRNTQIILIMMQLQNAQFRDSRKIAEDLPSL